MSLVAPFYVDTVYMYIQGGPKKEDIALHSNFVNCWKIFNIFHC